MASQVFILKERISVPTVAKILGKSEERVRQFCKSGLFKTAQKSGPGRNAPWTILREEVRCNSTLEPKT